MKLVILTLAMFGSVSLAADKWVDSWPKKLGTTWNPTPEQCRADGYELTDNRPAPTAEELAAQAAAVTVETDRLSAIRAAQATAASNSAVRIQDMVKAYQQTCAAIASEAGLTLTSNVLTLAQIDQACMPLAEDADSPAKIKRNFKLLALVLKLENQHRMMTQEGINAY